MITEDTETVLKLALKAADTYLYTRTPEGERDVLNGIITRHNTVAAIVGTMSQHDSRFKGVNVHLKFEALHIANELVRAANSAPRCMQADMAIATLSAIFNKEV